MSAITAHVLDTARGLPAVALDIHLERMDAQGGFARLSSSQTDNHGRVPDLAQNAGLHAGLYRLVFHTGPYFATQGVATFYPRVEVIFEVRDPSQHYHIPLLISPFSYCTYRGS